MKRKPARFILIFVAFLAILSTSIYIYIYNSRFHMPEFNDPAEGYLHFSVDDSNSIFEELTKNQEAYTSIFEQPLLGYVKDLHERYGIAISFYVFYSWNVETGRFTLAEATDKYAEEFSQNAKWLKFGFHAKDAGAYEALDTETEIAYYELTIRELTRITGSEDCIDHFIRLDRYWADSMTVAALHELTDGICGLLASSYPERRSYGLTETEKALLYAEDWYVDSAGVAYTPTDVQLENIENNTDFYEILSDIYSQPRIVVFTHEWILNDKNVQKYMEWFAQFASESGIPFAFPEDEI